MLEYYEAKDVGKCSRNKTKRNGFPHGSVSRQCKRHRFGPWARRIAKAVEQLGLQAVTTEPMP